MAKLELEFTEGLRRAWNTGLPVCSINLFKTIKCTVMEIDRLRVSKVSWSFCILTIYNFAVICPWNLVFSSKVAYLLTVSVVLSVFKSNFRFNNLKTRTAMNTKISLFVLKRSYICYYIICFSVPLCCSQQLN